jgi:chromosome segregation ATPase
MAEDRLNHLEATLQAVGQRLAEARSREEEARGREEALLTEVRRLAAAGQAAEQQLQRLGEARAAASAAPQGAPPG